MSDAIQNQEQTEQVEQLNSVYWSPEAEVTLSGAELAAFFQLADIMYTDFGSLNFATLKASFELANNVKEVIVNRMNEQGLLSNTPI